MFWDNLLRGNNEEKWSIIKKHFAENDDGV